MVFPPPSSLLFTVGFAAELLIAAVISLKGEEDAPGDEVPCLAVLAPDAVDRAAATDCAALRDFEACLAIFWKDGEYRRENTIETNVRGIFLAIFVNKKWKIITYLRQLHFMTRQQTSPGDTIARRMDFKIAS